MKLEKFDEVIVDVPYYGKVQFTVHEDKGTFIEGMPVFAKDCLKTPRQISKIHIVEKIGG